MRCPIPAFAFVLACASNGAPPPECPPVPVCESSGEVPAEPTPIATPTPEPPTPEPEAPDERPAYEVRVGTCGMDAVPPAMRAEVSAEETATLAAEVQRWLEGGQVGLTARAGIAFAKSEDDTGADPPYPSWIGAQAKHVCGIESLWLRDALRTEFQDHGGEYRNAPITCEANVCCFAALGEYDSAGGAVFTREGDLWYLRAAYRVADNGTLGEDYIAEGYRSVQSQLARLARRQCRDEPR